MPEDQKSSDYLYLEKLKFDPKLRNSWLNFFVSNFRVVILLIILISVWGIYSFTRLPRESNPEVKIPIAIVGTVYPGASPEDIEELVTKKVETGISGIKGIDKITSSSANSFSAIVVEFGAGENLDDSLRKLKDQVTSLQKDLPEEALESDVREISFDDRPILTFALTGPYDGFTLREEAEKIQDELEKISGVREVKVSGGDELEFEIAYDPGKLVYYNISPVEANQAVTASNTALPAGNFEGEEFNYSVRTDARFFDTEKLKNIPISHTTEGSIVYLKDIAEVNEKAIKRTIYSRLSKNGSESQNSITIDIIKKTGGSVIDTSSRAKKTVDELIKVAPNGMTYAVTVDFAKIIKEDFDQLTHDFILTLFMVSLVLLLAIGIKEAFVAGIAIPLVFFVTFGVMDVMGITLNFLSIFSLLLSLGLLVDDAIVVVSATKQYLRTGKFTPEEAVLLVLNDFKLVLTTTTLTTVWAFLPLLLSTGIMGEFIKSIPITVSVTLIASLFIALMINHPLAAVLERVRFKRTFFWLTQLFLLSFSGFSFFYLKSDTGILLGIAGLLAVAAFISWYLRGGRQKTIANEKLVEREWDDPELIKDKLRTQGNKDYGTLKERFLHGIIDLNGVLPLYEKHLRFVIKTRKRRFAVLGSIFIIFIFSVLLPVTGIVPTEFFPASNEDTLYINVEAPAGLKLDKTDKVASKIEGALLKYKEIDNFSTIVGNAGASPNQVGGGSTQNPSNLASMVVTLIPKKDREITSYDLAKKIRENLSDIQEAKITVESARGGPPSGASFEARILGEDLQTLDRVANELKLVLADISGVVDAKVSLKEAPAEYTFSLDAGKMELYNLNAVTVGSVLRMAISGVEVTKVLKENKEIKVIAIFEEDKIPTLESIQNLEILNFQKKGVFLKDVAKIELSPSVESITRIDQKRAVLLSAGVEGKTRPNAVLAEFQGKIKDYSLPESYEIVYGGENEQNNESVISILQAMVLAALLIVSTLIIQFNSFKKSFIVLVTFPLALIGVFVGLAIFRINLSFPGLIGILALFGIVVKNAIILIDKINLNLKSGIPFEDSIVDAGKSRLEAIFITSICTILGIIPVTLSNELWMALGGAIIFGLSLSSFLTLMIVPVMFATIIKKGERF